MNAMQRSHGCPGRDHLRVSGSRCSRAIGVDDSEEAVRERSGSEEEQKNRDIHVPRLRSRWAL